MTEQRLPVQRDDNNVLSGLNHGLAKIKYNFMDSLWLEISQLLKHL